MRGPRAANLSTRDPPPAEAERAEKVPRADKQRLAGGPTTPPSSPHPHLSERKGDQQAVHRLPRVPKQAPLQRDPGRCRLHPRGPRSGGEVEPLPRAPRTRGTSSCSLLAAVVIELSRGTNDHRNSQR